jgi:hypothetical protein
MGFQNFEIIAQSPKLLAYGFTVNRQLPAKTDRNSVFHSRDPHIPDWLYIMVPYMSFYGF